MKSLVSRSGKSPGKRRPSSEWNHSCDSQAGVLNNMENCSPCGLEVQQDGASNTRPHLANKHPWAPQSQPCPGYWGGRSWQSRLPSAGGPACLPLSQRSYFLCTRQFNFLSNLSNGPTLKHVAPDRNAELHQEPILSLSLFPPKPPLCFICRVLYLFSKGWGSDVSGPALLWPSLCTRHRCLILCV